VRGGRGRGLLGGCGEPWLERVGWLDGGRRSRGESRKDRDERADRSEAGNGLAALR